ncbi:MAG: Hsp20/alpha crystallin family protein [Candidatus Nanopelagicales bacterium]
MSLVKRERSDLVEAFRRFFSTELEDKSWLRVEEYVDDNTHVIRAELPGIDPEKDLDISVVNGTLVIKAEREEKSEKKDKDSYRSEFRYGSFIREITLPAGCKDADVTAAYIDGVLEVRVPIGEVPKVEPVKIPISRV